MRERADKPAAELVAIDAHNAGQRIDNFLRTRMKGVPKTRLYRALRAGEVRVNSGRIKPSYQLQPGDRVRLPPLRRAQQDGRIAPPPKLAQKISKLFEDDALLIVDKPPGLPVHGGSGHEFGLIEVLRAARDDEFLELAHRLDIDTSGCLVLCKNRAALLAVQSQFSANERLQKIYLALLQGELRAEQKVDARLEKFRTQASQQQRVRVAARGQSALSVFHPTENFRGATLAQIELKTGRMHQARVHAQSIGHPIAGDAFYGDKTFNREMQKIGLGRLFLHASELTLQHPSRATEIRAHAELPPALCAVLDKLRA